MHELPNFTHLSDFLAFLRERDIRLRAEDGKLRFDAPKGAMTDAILAYLKQHKTGLMALLEAEQIAANADDLVPAPDGAIKPLSFFQDWFWLNQQKNPNSCLYNLPRLFYIRGPLDVEPLRASLAIIMRRHEILRTVFRQENGIPVQQVVQEGCVPLTVQTYLGLNAAEQAQRWEELTQDCTRRPLRLNERPAWRATLAQFDEEDWLLVFCHHHIIFDVWSLNVKLHELGIIYAALTAGQAIPLPNLPVQYSDFAYWEQHVTAPKAEAASLAYWQNWFARGVPPAVTLSCQKNAATVGVQAHVTRYHFPETVASALTSLTQAHDATLFMAVLAGFATLLHHYSECDDIVLSVPFMAPTHWKQEALIGPTGRILAIRMDLRGNPSFVELLRQARESVLAAFSGQTLPFWVAMQRLGIPQNRPGPLFHALLTYTPGIATGTLPLPNMQTSSILPKEVTMLIHLALIIWEEKTADGIHLAGWWQYKLELFDNESIANITNDFQHILQLAGQAPQQSLQSLRAALPARGDAR